MQKQLYFPILLGTRRKDRQSEYVAQLLLEEAAKREEFTAELFDPREMQFPEDNEGQDIKDLNPMWRDAVQRADGLMIVAPEYNHGYSGSLKLALDMLLKEYIHKPTALCGVSSGGFGGTRVIEALLPVVRELGLAATFTDLNFSRVQSLFDESGNLTDESMRERIHGYFDELVFMARALKWGREHVPSKHHQD